MSDKDIGFFKRLLLKIITKLQEKTLDFDDIDFYYTLTKLHFKLYFGGDLIEEAINDTDNFKKAARRHGCMCIKIFPGDRRSISRLKNNKKCYYNTRLRLTNRAFRDNLILQVRLT